MNRSALILGFALLVVAATLAITITFRNDPRRAPSARSETTTVAGDRSSAPVKVSSGISARTGRPPLVTKRAPNRFEVTVAPEDLAALSPSEQADFRREAGKVQHEARKRLEHMTREFDLTSVQRAKMFPIVVRSTPGYDPAMQVAGGYLGLDPVNSADEELHDLFEPDQQEQLEDKEVDRQLWWQDVFSRIEADLVNSTGGLPTGTPETDTEEGTTNPADTGGDRVAPASRGAVKR